MSPFHQKGVCWFLLVLVMLMVVVVVVGDEDLYRVLGVSRSASSREIKTAYKRLAKLWHPDKNKSPEAREKILLLNKAYEILTDDEKRHHYDITGETGKSPHPIRGHDTGQGGFTVFQSGNTFHFRFNTGSHRPRTDSVTTNDFFDNIIPASYLKPHLFNFYHDFCMQCMNVEAIWDELRNEIGSLGVGLGSVHVNLHPRITHHCGVSHVPSIVGVVSGRVIHYHGPLSTKPLRDFVESLLPSWIITELTASNLDAFLSQAIERNRPRVILLSPRIRPSLLYKLTAFAHHKAIDFAYVSSDVSWNSGNGPVLRRFGIGPREKLLLVFKEYHDPVMSLEASQLNSVSLQSAMEGMLLYLPRLSAPHVFDSVCPYPSMNRLCVMLLVSEPTLYNDSITNAFREVARQGMTIPHKTVSFAYIDSSKQTAFVAALGPHPINMGSCGDGTMARPIVILRRTSNRRVQFDWFNQFCGDVDDLRGFLLSPQLRNSAYVPAVEDEEAPGWLGRIWNKVVEFGQNLSDFVSALDSHIFTTLLTFLFAAITLCLMGSLGGAEEEPPRKSKSTVVGISRLDRRRYTELVEKVPRRPITLVLLVDTHEEERARHLKKTFCQVVHKYNSSRMPLILYYLCYQTYGTWLARVLKHCDDMETKDVTALVNACHGGKTVMILALFIARKQLCIFPEQVDNDSVEEALYERREVHSVGGVLGNTLGFETETDVKDHSDVEVKDHSDVEIKDHSDVVEDSGTPNGDVCSNRNSSSGMNHHRKGTVTNLQFSQKLTLWMEKLADGSLKRYHVRTWPNGLE